MMVIVIGRMSEKLNKDVVFCFTQFHILRIQICRLADTNFLLVVLHRYGYTVHTLEWEENGRVRLEPKMKEE